MFAHGISVKQGSEVIAGPNAFTYFNGLNITGDYTDLSYTNFICLGMTLSTTNVTSSSDLVNVSVTVTNFGSVIGNETVMLFLTQPYRSISVPEVKQLKRLSTISLEIRQGLKLVAEDADYVVAIKPEMDCDVYNETAAANPLCATFTLSMGEHPFSSLVAE